MLKTFFVLGTAVTTISASGLCVRRPIEFSYPLSKEFSLTEYFGDETSNGFTAPTDMRKLPRFELSQQLAVLEQYTPFAGQIQLRAQTSKNIVGIFKDVIETGLTPPEPLNPAEKYKSTEDENVYDPKRTTVRERINNYFKDKAAAEAAALSAKAAAEASALSASEDKGKPLPENKHPLNFDEQREGLYDFERRIGYFEVSLPPLINLYNRWAQKAFEILDKNKRPSASQSASHVADALSSDKKKEVVRYLHSSLKKLLSEKPVDGWGDRKSEDYDQLRNGYWSSSDTDYETSISQTRFRGSAKDNSAPDFELETLIDDVISIGGIKNLVFHLDDFIPTPSKEFGKEFKDKGDHAHDPVLGFHGGDSKGYYPTWRNILPKAHSGHSPKSNYRIPAFATENNTLLFNFIDDNKMHIQTSYVEANDFPVDARMVTSETVKPVWGIKEHKINTKRLFESYFKHNKAVLEMSDGTTEHIPFCKPKHPVPPFEKMTTNPIREILTNLTKMTEFMKKTTEVNRRISKLQTIEVELTFVIKNLEKIIGKTPGKYFTWYDLINIEEPKRRRLQSVPKTNMDTLLSVARGVLSSKKDGSDNKDKETELSSMLAIIASHRNELYNLMDALQILFAIDWVPISVVKDVRRIVDVRGMGGRRRLDDKHFENFEKDGTFSYTDIYSRPGTGQYDWTERLPTIVGSWDDKKKVTFEAAHHNIKEKLNKMIENILKEPTKFRLYADEQVRNLEKNAPNKEDLYNFESLLDMSRRADILYGFEKDGKAGTLELLNTINGQLKQIVDEFVSFIREKDDTIFDDLMVVNGASGAAIPADAAVAKTAQIKWLQEEMVQFLADKLDTRNPRLTVYGKVKLIENAMSDVSKFEDISKKLEPVLLLAEQVQLDFDKIIDIQNQEKHTDAWTDEAKDWLANYTNKEKTN